MQLRYSQSRKDLSLSLSLRGGALSLSLPHAHTHAHTAVSCSTQKATALNDNAGENQTPQKHSYTPLESALTMLLGTRATSLLHLRAQTEADCSKNPVKAKRRDVRRMTAELTADLAFPQLCYIC